MSQIERLEELRRYGLGKPATSWLTDFVADQQAAGKRNYLLGPALMKALESADPPAYSLSLGPSRRGGWLLVLKRAWPAGPREVAFIGGSDVTETFQRAEQMFSRLKWRKDKYQR